MRMNGTEEKGEFKDEIFRVWKKKVRRQVTSEQGEKIKAHSEGGSGGKENIDNVRRRGGGGGNNRCRLSELKGTIM